MPAWLRKTLWLALTLAACIRYGFPSQDVRR